MPVEDSSFERIVIPVPRRGVLEGYDPAQPDFGPDFTPDAENLRLHLGLWQTRLGISRWTSSHAQSLPAAAAIHFLARFYKSDGTRVSLAAAGGTLYERENAAAGWSSVTGGTGLNTSPQNGCYNHVTLLDYVYFTDRDDAENLKRYAYSAPGAVTDVTQITAPTTAPTTRRRIWKTFEAWAGSAGSAPTNWTDEDAANFDIDVADLTADATPDFAISGAVAKLDVDPTGSRNDTVSRSDAAFTLESNYLAFFALQTSGRDKMLTFEVGVTGHGEKSLAIDVPEPDEVFLVVLETKGIETLKFRRFRVSKVPGNAQSFYASQMVLSGRLFGKYRYVYTHKRKDTGEESEPSPATEFIDCSLVPVNGITLETAALEKSIEIGVTSDSGADATTTEIKVYQNGGAAPGMFTDETGADVWIPIATIPDLSTQLNGAVVAGATSAVLDAVAVGSGSNEAVLAAGDWLVFEKGTDDKQEFVQIDTVTVGTLTVTFKTALLYDHADNQDVQAAWVANEPDEVVLTSLERLEVERDSPPQGSHWLAKAPDERLWIFRYEGKPLGVAVSNQPTVVRPLDHQVFPSGVNPLLRRHPTQGWRFNVSGDASGDEIVWGGFFAGVPTVLTKRAMYRIHAYSQADWGPSVVSRVFDNTGCIAGETVQEVAGFLYWVADGPRLMRFDGRGVPEEVGFQRFTTTLRNAPSAHWTKWFARAHSDADGPWYRLWIVPSGATTATLRLDYSPVFDTWQTVQNHDSGGTDIAWVPAAVVWDGGSDARELYVGQAGATGQIYQHETGSTENGEVIRIRGKTRKIPLPGVCQVHYVRLRLAAVTDTITVKVLTGGSEYGDASSSPTAALSGSGDKEIVIRTDYTTLIGNWAQVEISGSVSNRPAVRELELWVLPVRQGRVTA